MHPIAALEGYALSMPQETPAELDLSQLVSAYAPLLFRVAHSLLRNPVEAEDVVQDVFLRVLTQRTSLAGIKDPRVWLIRIAWNLALDRKRRKRPDQLDEAFARTLAASLQPPDQAFADSNRLAAVLHQIDSLPKLERQALLLTALEELNTAEVAHVLNKSESATRALVFRARTRLRERLEKGSR